MFLWFFRSFFKIKKAQADFSAVTAEELNQFIKWFVLAELPPAVIYNGHTSDTITCMKLGKEYFPSVVENVVNAQKEISDKRKEKVFKRIADLRTQKNNLAKAKPAEKQKPVTAKKTAKKK